MTEGQVRWGAVGAGVAGLLVFVAAIGAAAGWVEWSAVGRALVPRTGLIVVFGVAGVLVAGAGWRLRRGPADRPGAAAPLSWWLVAAGAAVVVVVAWGATSWLLAEAGQAQDPAAARMEAIKTGLTIGAGTGGVFALLLAVRRQWHQELTAADTALDAAAKRVTELYAKAADQLGSETALVRLAGLYALERLAQDNPGQRQTIVNVLCAYLRMPYTLPGDPPAPDANEQAAANYQQRRQEREVRVAAQRILADHLRQGDDVQPVATFWTGMDLDFTGATLIDVDLDRARLQTARFGGATFVGDAGFAGATFTQSVVFDGATFTGDAVFGGATFIKDAGFGGATFIGNAGFSLATFTRHAGFGGATFTRDAGFGGATFTRHARFGGATFTGNVRFGRATFTGNAGFDEVTFTGDAVFRETVFRRGVPTELARFMEGRPAGETSGEGEPPPGPEIG